MNMVLAETKTDEIEETRHAVIEDTPSEFTICQRFYAAFMLQCNSGFDGFVCSRH